MAKIVKAYETAPGAFNFDPITAVQFTLFNIEKIVNAYRSCYGQDGNISYEYVNANENENIPSIAIKNGTYTIATIVYGQWVVLHFGISGTNRPTVLTAEQFRGRYRVIDDVQ